MSRAETIRKWNQSEKGKRSARRYRNGHGTLYKKGGSQYEAKVRRYKKYADGARNAFQEYTVSDNELILSKAIPDIEIAKKLGRSLSAIGKQRYKLKAKESPPSRLCVCR